MKLNQYQTHTRETAIYPEQDALIYTVLGLTGESGEIAEKVKKLIRDDKCLTIADMPDHVRDELIFRTLEMCFGMFLIWRMNLVRL